MGSMGSDVAVATTDIALMSNDISKLPYLKRLSIATVGTIKLSITLSIVHQFPGCDLIGAGQTEPHHWSIGT